MCSQNVGFDGAESSGRGLQEAWHCCLAQSIKVGRCAMCLESSFLSPSPLHPIPVCTSQSHIVVCPSLSASPHPRPYLSLLLGQSPTCLSSGDRKPPHFVDLKTEAQRGKAVQLISCRAGISPTPCACSALLCSAGIPWDAELLNKCILYVRNNPQMDPLLLKKRSSYPWRSVGVQGRGPSYLIF